MTPQDLRLISTVRRLIANGKARARREGLRLTLREVADVVGVAPSAVHRWEQGAATPRGAHALRWAEALGIGPDTGVEVPCPVAQE